MVYRYYTEEFQAAARRSCFFPNKDKTRLPDSDRHRANQHRHHQTSGADHGGYNNVMSNWARNCRGGARGGLLLLTRTRRYGSLIIANHQAIRTEIPRLSHNIPFFYLESALYTEHWLAKKLTINYWDEMTNRKYFSFVIVLKTPGANFIQLLSR